jgi:hypothetical protein
VQGNKWVHFPTGVTYTLYTFTEAGTFTFACQEGSHCSDGQIVTVVVAAAEPETGDQTGDGAPDPCTTAGGVELVDSGTVSSGQYASDQNCEWHLRCSDDSLSPKLTFSAFDTEESYDFVSIFEGMAAAGQPAHQLHGTNVPDSIVGAGSAQTVQLTSDDALEGDGFSAEFTCVDGGAAGSCSEDPSNDGKKCAAGPNRVFELRGEDATLDACRTACNLDPSCVAFSVIISAWCIGCSVPLDSEHGGSTAYVKQLGSTDSDGGQHGDDDAATCGAYKGLGPYECVDLAMVVDDTKATHICADGTCSDAQCCKFGVNQGQG